MAIRSTVSIPIPIATSSPPPADWIRDFVRGEDKIDLTLFNTGSDFLVKVVGQPLDADDFVLA
nr:M10 family metallopeptidase C-terminal domain-containing protein [Serratia marcescens]